MEALLDVLPVAMPPLPGSDFLARLCVPVLLLPDEKIGEEIVTPVTCVIVVPGWIRLNKAPRALNAQPGFAMAC